MKTFMRYALRTALFIGSIALFGSLSTAAFAYRCGQSRPCPGGYNPYNPDSYNHVAEHGYNQFGSIGGTSAGEAAYTKVAHPGEKIRLRYFYSVNPDCVSIGHYELKLTSAPRGGSVFVQSGRDYTNFPQSNVRWTCNRRKSPVDEVFYRSLPNFSGEDSFDMESISPDHIAKSIHFTVQVE